MNFSELARICEGKILNLKEDVEVTNLLTDSRNLSFERGAVFFAIEGQNHDGHKYIDEAIGQGIKYFIIEKEPADFEEASFIQVDSSISALQKVASFHRSNFQYPVIAITGSNGKTIVKEWLGSMLDGLFKVVKSPKSYNSQIGVPLSVWAMNQNHGIAIFEAGISQANEMANLHRIIRPTIGIFTNIGDAHNEGFQSKVHKTQEKSRLFEGCEKIIYPLSDRSIHETLTQKFDNDVLFGWEIISVDNQEYEIKFQGITLKLKLKFTEPYFIENALNCAVTLTLLGLKSYDIQLGLKNLPAIKMRLELKQAIGQSYLIDDTYNNDLHGLEVALDFLSRHNQKKNKSVVLSDVSQSGLTNKELYTKVDALLKKYGVTKFTGIGPDISENRNSFHLPSAFYDNTSSFLADKMKLNDEIVLIKGARNFEFEQIVDRLEKSTHQTVLQINLENLVHNLNYYRSKLRSNVRMMAMVKAYAYGGGILEIANLLQYHKIAYLGVAYANEAVELRKNGIYIPIMVMNPSPDSFRQLQDYNLEPEIYSLELLYEFSTYFEDADTVPGVHLKLETGMNRLGFTKKEIPQLMRILERNKHIRIKSIFSHLAGSESPMHDSFTEQQANSFDILYSSISESLWYNPIKHLVNTGGISRFPQYHYDMVRLGIGMYGYDPTEDEQKALRPVGFLTSNISQLRKITKGQTVGYGRSGVASKDMQLAIVPIGYADGYLRAFSNGRGYMSIGNKKAPVFGNVCMDMTMLDVTDISCTVGDEVTVFGYEPSIKTLANQINTIPYEILTNIGPRVRRVFQSE